MNAETSVRPSAMEAAERAFATINPAFVGLPRVQGDCRELQALLRQVYAMELVTLCEHAAQVGRCTLLLEHGKALHLRLPIPGLPSALKVDAQHAEGLPASQLYALLARWPLKLRGQLFQALGAEIRGGSLRYSQPLRAGMSPALFVANFEAVRVYLERAADVLGG